MTPGIPHLCTLRPILNSILDQNYHWLHTNDQITVKNGKKSFKSGQKVV